VKVGDVMVPREGPYSGSLACGSGIYTHAILVSVEPFVMVSEEGDMLWACATPSNYVALCQASWRARRKAFARFKNDRALAAKFQRERESASRTGAPHE